jgi:hypothetical protein
VIFVDKATESVATHNWSSSFSDGDWRSALWYAEVETAVGSFSVVVID